MRAITYLVAGLSLALLPIAAASRANADEYGFSSYGLGGAAFGAGVTLRTREKEEQLGEEKPGCSVYHGEGYCRD
jgi:hypothetical protein